MTTLRTVLAATDLSAPSRHAVTRAAMLARDCGARLELLHVIVLVQYLWHSGWFWRSHCTGGSSPRLWWGMTVL
jgi:nucleotide-binding universal stress UspA family protein